MHDESVAPAPRFGGGAAAPPACDDGWKNGWWDAASALTLSPSFLFSPLVSAF
jgi:hypothetical protein